MINSNLKCTFISRPIENIQMCLQLDNTRLRSTRMIFSRLRNRLRVGKRSDIQGCIAVCSRMKDRPQQSYFVALKMYGIWEQPDQCALQSKEDSVHDLFDYNLVSYHIATASLYSLCRTTVQWQSEVGREEILDMKRLRKRTTVLVNYATDCFVAQKTKLRHTLP